MYVQKKPRGNIIISRLLQGIWLHTQREDGANNSQLQPPLRNRRSHNDVIVNHESKSPHTEWRHMLLRHCSKCSAKRIISLIPVYYLPRLRTQNVLDSMKENDFKLAKERSRRYPTQTITDVDHTDDIALLANTPTQAESQPNCLERAAGGISLHVNADKIEYMCFNQRGDISTLKDGPLKLVDKFTFLGSSASLTDTDINTRLAKAWIDIDRLLVI